MRPRTDAAVAAAFAGVVAGVVDGLAANLRGASAPGFVVVAAGLLGTVLFLPGWTAIAAARWGWPVWNAEGRAARLGALAAAAWGLVAVGVVLFWGGRWVLEHTAAELVGRRFVPLAILSIGIGLAVWRGLHRGLRGRRGRASIAAGSLVVATLASVPALVVMVETVDVRFTGVLATWIAALFAWPRLQRWIQPRWRRVEVLVPWPIFLIGTGWLVAAPDMRLVAARYAPLSGHAARVVGRVADFDGDGYSPLSGEGDCAPFDAAVHPFAVDVPGNGVDEDCHGGDLDPNVVAVRSAEVEAPLPRERPNVLLVTVETLRADHMGIFGYRRDTTPRIDAWFRDGVIFERAYATSPVTDRSLPSLFGGLYPSMYTEALEYREHRLSDRRVLLAERLRDADYATAAFVTYHAVGAHNLHQGFDLIEHRIAADDQHARPMTDRVLKHLRHHRARTPNRPFFVWVHYYDPHSTYQPPDRHRLWGEEPIDRYDGEIHYVDAEIGRLLDALERWKLVDDTLVVLAADHGEEFLDHGATGHAKQLYDESMRVPLLMRGPGLPQRRTDVPVTLADVMPTLLDLLEIPAPPALEGRSQASFVRGGDPVARPILMEQFRHGSSEIEKIAVVDGWSKLIYDHVHQTWELYDLRTDPAERENLHGRDPDLTNRLRTSLLDHWARVTAARLLDPPEGAF